MANCIKCGSEIHPGRLKALPGTRVCVECSSTDKVRGFRVITGKTTYSEIQLVDAKKFKELSTKQSRIGQSPARGIWMSKP